MIHSDTETREELDQSDDTALFIVGGPESQARQILRHNKSYYGSGIEDNDENAAKDSDDERERRIADLFRNFNESYIRRLLDPSSDYNQMTRPGSRYYYCYQQATEQERRRLADAGARLQQAQEAADQKQDADSFVDLQEAKTDKAKTETEIVENHGGTAEDSRQAAEDGKKLREHKQRLREVREEMRGKSEPEKREILHKRLPEEYEQDFAKARDGRHMSRETRSAAASCDTPGEPIQTSVQLKHGFNAAAQPDQTETAPAPAVTPAAQPSIQAPAGPG